MPSTPALSTARRAALSRPKPRSTSNAFSQGKAQDVPLEGGDILFVPGSMSKKVGLRTVEAAIQTASGIAIWRF